MKKIICILLSLLMAAFMLAGCGKAPAGQQNADAPQTQQAADDNTADAPDQPDTPDEPAAQDDSANTGMTPADSYERYIEAKANAYEALMEKIGENADLSLTGGMALLPLTMIDLYALPISFLSGDAAASEAAAGIMGIQGLSINTNGNHFTMSYEDSENGKSTMEGDFDPATDSLTSRWSYDQSKTALLVEYVKYKNGYAGQYFTVNEDGTNSIIKVIVDGDDIAFGLSDGGSEPASIYKTAPAGFSFVDGCTTIFKFEGGKGYSLVDGEEAAF